MHAPTHHLAGIGLRSAHAEALVESRPALGWLEVHPENYFCGGLHARRLESARDLYPVSFHAVGLSLGSTERVSTHHLAKLKALMSRIEPVRVSDHASWSASGNAHLNDLLPLPYTAESLAALCRNIDITQEYLGRPILIENPSTYLQFAASTMPEPEFLSEAVRRTGCGLLLDVNNVYVQAHNHGFDAVNYLDHIPPQAVQQMHLAGHTVQAFGDATLLVDTHNQPVCDGVWQLYAAAVARFGPTPTLIEWDKDLPSLEVLVSQAQRAASVMAPRTEVPHAA